MDETTPTLSGPIHQSPFVISEESLNRDPNRLVLSPDQQESIEQDTEDYPIFGLSIRKLIQLFRS